MKFKKVIEHSWNNIAGKIRQEKKKENTEYNKMGEQK